MQKQEGKIGAIPRNVHGTVCSRCGSRSYQVVLRGVEGSRVELLACCRRCRCARDMNEELERILWI